MEIEKKMRDLLNSENLFSGNYKFCNFCIKLHDGPIKYICNDCFIKECSNYLDEYCIMKDYRLMIFCEESGPRISPTKEVKKWEKTCDEDILLKFKLSDYGVCVCNYCKQIRPIGYLENSSAICVDCLKEPVLFSDWDYISKWPETEGNYSIFIASRYIGWFGVQLVGELAFCSVRYDMEDYMPRNIYFTINKTGELTLGRSCCQGVEEYLAVYEVGPAIEEPRNNFEKVMDKINNYTYYFYTIKRNKYPNNGVPVFEIKTRFADFILRCAFNEKNYEKFKYPKNCIESPLRKIIDINKSLCQITSDTSPEYIQQINFKRNKRSEVNLNYKFPKLDDSKKSMFFLKHKSQRKEFNQPPNMVQPTFADEITNNYIAVDIISARG